MASKYQGQDFEPSQLVSKVFVLITRQRSLSEILYFIMPGKLLMFIRIHSLLKNGSLIPSL